MIFVEVFLSYLIRTLIPAQNNIKTASWPETLNKPSFSHFYPKSLVYRFATVWTLIIPLLAHEKVK